MHTDFTHHPARRSWVASANGGQTDFPIQNLPHGVFRRCGGGAPWRGGVAIGNQVLDLAALLTTGLVPAGTLQAMQAAAGSQLNAFMALGAPAWQAVRETLSTLLAEGAHEATQLQDCLVPQAECEHRLPAQVGDFTDFFTSVDHMRNMGRLFQPDKPLLPQFHWLPIGYHGRASTVVVSGAPVPRPWGQRLPTGATAPEFVPTQALDYELELGAWVGPGTARGQGLTVTTATQRLFGIGLLNDWSARDLQAWESVPLGPFMAKNFCTTVSPWIVTMAALAPFACTVRRDTDCPPWLPHLAPPADAPALGLDLQLEVWLETADAPGPPQRISHTSSRHASWGFAQMLAHHSSNGCALAPGDLLGSGTQSGPGPGEQGCLMELTEAGRTPLRLADGTERRLLQDGDTVILRAWGERPGAVRIGLGECRGTVLPALDRPQG
jgi:fumarylacetoacetase